MTEAHRLGRKALSRRDYLRCRIWLSPAVRCVIGWEVAPERNETFNSVSTSREYVPLDSGGVGPPRNSSAGGEEEEADHRHPQHRSSSSDEVDLGNHQSDSYHCGHPVQPAGEHP